MNAPRPIERTLRPSVAAVLALAAGSASLGFEVLWVRLLTLEVGGPLTAFTIVVAAFMLGLSLGAWSIGRLADRVTEPLSLFAACQMAVAVAGILSSRAGPAVRMVLSGLDHPPGSTSFLIAEATLGAVLVAVPAFMMGGTLPLLMRAAARAGGAARLCGLLASFNAAGAAAGALGTGFLLLPRLGLRGSLLAASGISFAVGFTALGMRRLARRSPAAAAEAGNAASEASLPFAGVLVLLVIPGGVVTALELVWTRLSSLSFGSSAQAASLVLACVIAGLAIGNLLGSRLAASVASRPHRLVACALAAAGTTLLSDPLLGRLPLLAARLSMDASPGGWIALSPAREHLLEAVLLFLVAGPPCILLGAIFPLGFGAIALRRTRSGAGAVAGIASAATSLGNLAGAPCALFVLATPLGSRAILIGCAALLSLACLPFAPRGASRALSVVILIAACLAALLPGWDPALISSGPFLYGSIYRAASGDFTRDLDTIMRARGDVVFLHDGPHAFVTVRRRDDGVLSLQVDGKTDASTGGDMKTQTLTAQLPLLAWESARNGLPGEVLVVGMGSGVSAGAALSHPIAACDVVEISGAVVEASRLFSAYNGDALHDPRLSLILDDARSWLRFGARRYDIIASQPSNPWVSGQAALFTREFFESALARLAPEGIMSQWLQGQGLSAMDFRSVVATFTAVFPHASLWEESTSGGDYLLLGSANPLTIDPARLREAMRREAVAANLERVGIEDPADLLALHVADADRLREYGAGASIQTEDRLALEHTAPAALHVESLGSILASLEPWRVDNAAEWASDPPLAEALAARARASRKERAWAEGLGLFDVRPFDPALQDAVSWLRGGLPHRAFAAVRALGIARPEDPLPRLVEAHIAMSLGLHDDAVRALRTALEHSDDSPRVRLYLARALFASGRVGEALAENQASIRDRPDSAEAASDRCAMLLTLDDLPTAEAACRDAIALDPDIAEAHANLGLVHARRGRWVESEESYRRALILDSALDDARYNLAALYERTGRQHEGLQALLPLVRRAPRDAVVLRLAARLALQAGETASAEDWIRRSLELEPENEESRELARNLRSRRP